MRSDPSGHSWLDITLICAAVVVACAVAVVAAPVLATAGVITCASAFASGAFALGTVAAAGGLASAAMGMTEAMPKTISLPKAQAKSQVKEKEKTKTTSPPKDTVVYRWPDRGTLNVSYTPSVRDLQFPNSGLSFSTIPKPGSAMTTIEALNATGIVYAVPDGLNHVSVYPVGGTLAGWNAAGSSSIWSQAVQSVCVQWDGN